jgi:AcrR family transcriptional regulator
MRRHGAAGTGVAELVATSGVARRSLYVNFPGGKDELVAEATSVAGRFISTLIRDSGDPVSVLRALTAMWRTVLTDSDFQSGCPVAAAALASNAAPSGPPAAAAAFAIWRAKLTTCFEAAGIPAAEAAPFAQVAIASIEGAVMVALADRSTAALDAVEEHLTQSAAARLTALLRDHP